MQVKHESGQHQRGQETHKQRHLTGEELILGQRRDHQADAESHDQEQHRHTHNQDHRAAQRQLIEVPPCQQAQQHAEHRHTEIRDQFGQDQLQDTGRRHEQGLERAPFPLPCHDHGGQEYPDDHQHQHDNARHKEPRTRIGIIEPDPADHACPTAGCTDSFFGSPGQQSRLDVGLRRGSRCRLHAIDDDLHLCRFPGQIRREMDRHTQDRVDLMGQQPRLRLLHGGHIHGREILRTIHERDCLSGRRRMILQHDRHGDVLHIQRHAVADQQDQHDRHDDAQQQAALVAQQLIEFFPGQRGQPPEKGLSPHNYPSCAR